MDQPTVLQLVQTLGAALIAYLGVRFTGRRPPAGRQVECQIGSALDPRIPYCTSSANGSPTGPSRPLSRLTRTALLMEGTAGPQ